MKKVAVVGGGISGLATAYEIDKRLRASGGHYELRLFEAEARVGGKIGAARLLDPMVAGVFAGDPERLSLGSCFPRIAELERDHKSLIRALLALQLKRGRRSGGGPAGPGGTLTSFAGGMSVLPDTLAQTLADRVTCGAPLIGVERHAQGYRLSLGADRQIYDCDAAVLALQAADAVTPLQSLDAELAGVLEQFEYAPVAVVGLGFEQAALQTRLDGFGFLVPGEERRRILGSLWTSSIFAHRAPDGCVLLRTLIGGARKPELALLPETQLVELARAELRQILGISAQPVFVQVFQWPRAICQYTVGHRERLERVEARLSALPGLFLTGNSYRGVALNDCTQNAVQVADAVTGYLAPPA